MDHQTIARSRHATGALLLAEGVETEAEMLALQKCGAHLFQGYYFGRPEIYIPHTTPRKAVG